MQEVGGLREEVKQLQAALRQAEEEIRRLRGDKAALTKDAAMAKTRVEVKKEFTEQTVLRVRKVRNQSTNINMFHYYYRPD